MSCENKGKWCLAGIALVGVVVGVALVSMGTAVVHWSGSTEFCGSFCHSMDYVTAAYKKGQHYATKSGATAQCVDCHLKYESEHSISQAQVVGLLFHKAESGLSSLWGEIRGTLATPELQKEKQEELSEKYLTWLRANEYVTCKGCHNLERMENKDKPMIAMMHKTMAKNPKTDCVGCHTNAGHKYE